MMCMNESHHRVKQEKRGTQEMMVMMVIWEKRSECGMILCDCDKSAATLFKGVNGTKGGVGIKGNKGNEGPKGLEVCFLHVFSLQSRPVDLVNHREAKEM